MSSQVDAVLKLTREIFHLEQQERAVRAKREARKLELARLLAGEPGNEAQQRPEFRPGSLPARVLELLTASAPTSMNADAMARALGHDINAIRAVLSRLKAGGQIEKTGRGEYRARTEAQIDPSGKESAQGVGENDRKEDV
jgi:predicted Rossmann fold nucleotide-binding protein DprA/Smf involved in DNA uptake